MDAMNYILFNNITHALCLQEIFLSFYFFRHFDRLNGACRCSAVHFDTSVLYTSSPLSEGISSDPDTKKGPEGKCPGNTAENMRDS